MQIDEGTLGAQLFGGLSPNELKWRANAQDALMGGETPRISEKAQAAWEMVGGGFRKSGGADTSKPFTNEGDGGNVVNDAGSKGDTVTLYRVMSSQEFDSLMENQEFLPYDMAMEEKWLTTTPENAVKWAELFYPDGNYKLVELEVDSQGLDNMFYSENLDNIGSAYCSPIDVLNEYLKSIKEVK